MSYHDYWRGAKIQIRPNSFRHYSIATWLCSAAMARLTISASTSRSNRSRTWHDVCEAAAAEATHGSVNRQIAGS